MQNTRQQILTHLANNHTTSAMDISRALGMTTANARHHLNVLQENGFVNVAGEIPIQGRGRPTLLYMATAQAQSNNLAELITALISEFVTKGKQNLNKRLQKVARSLSAGVDKSGSITQRLYAATRHLDTMNYRSHWEAHADGPQIIFGQCPYAAIIEDHPELCTMDAYILEDILGTDVEQTAKIEYQPSGQAHCIFAARNTP